MLTAFRRVTTAAYARRATDLSWPTCHGDARNWFDAGERAPRVPRREGAHQPRRTVEPDAGVAERLGPGDLAGVPLHEGFGLRSDVEVFVEPGVRLADLRLAVLDQQPVTLVPS